MSIVLVPWFWRVKEIATRAHKQDNEILNGPKCHHIGSWVLEPTWINVEFANTIDLGIELDVGSCIQIELSLN
jgi:hypothetical protein